MQTYTANEAKTRFGEMLDRVQREPVQVTRHDRVVGVMVSAEDYEAMRQFYSERLLQLMHETGTRARANGLTEEAMANEAARNGLTPEILDQLLADES